MLRLPPGGAARARRRDESGASAIEFALVLPVLVMLLFGIITGGLSYTQSIGLTNAVREGARFGATADGSTASWGADVTARVRSSQFDDSADQATSATSVCVQLVKAPSTSVKSECSQGGSSGPTLAMPAISQHPKVPAGTPTGTCVVRVVAARSFAIETVMFPSMTGTATRYTVSRYERSSC